MNIQYRGRPCNRCPKVINQKRPDGTLFSLNNNIIGGHLSCKVRLSNKIQNAKFISGSTHVVYFINPPNLVPPCNQYTPLNSFVRKT